VEDARKAGAKVLCGGQRKAGTSGFFYEPTVLVDVPSTCRAATEEIFGRLSGRMCLHLPPC
jgi:succinate-semialdehyde dehydrogenase/glutarate-semialdehyde dehydrogenase